MQLQCYAIDEYFNKKINLKFAMKIIDRKIKKS